MINSSSVEILDLGEPIVGTGADSTISAQADIALTGAEVSTDETIRADYRYFSKEYIENLGIEGITLDFLLNIKQRKVVSYQGFKYQGEVYYTLEQLTNRIYNVEYQENTNQPTFDASAKQIGDNKWKITISNIQYDGYINKWQVKYQIDGQDYWNSSDNLEFIVNKEGTYKITINNGDISSNEKKLAVGVSELSPEDSSETELSQMLYGVIEIKFLNGTKYIETEMPNEPILKDGMKAVYWAKDSSGEIDTSNPASNTYEITSDDSNFKKENWYRYVAQNTSTEAGGSSRWANAKTSDGSYYVWIPRYSYRIVYFDIEDHENAYRAGTLTEEEALANNYIVGYSDARGIVDKDGKRPTSVSSTTAISVNDKKLRTHPVFDGDADEGGWDSKLTGIWVMKYEASRNDATADSTGSGTIPKSVPSVKSWVSTDVSTMFEFARDAYNKDGQLNTILNSHMIKNSEWGAVAYLADSKYGRNGTEISVNQCSDYITGAGRGTGDNPIYNSKYTWSSLTKDEQKYKGTVGRLSSTTGNIYGIYDISGGAYEYVMGFYGTDNNTPTFGSSGFTTSTFPSENKYYQIYLNSTNSCSNADGGILGDATKETKGWNSDYADFVYSPYPVFLRGGGYGDANSAGAFYFNGFNGDSYSSISFRVCLAVQ